MENKNWGKKYMLVLWSITLVVIICGLIYNIGGFGLHLAHLSSTKLTADDYTDFDFTSETFSSIDMDVAAADIDINYGDAYMVSTNIKEKYLPTIEVKNDTLIIREKQTGRGVNSFNDDCKINIIVPKGTKLENVEIEADAGDIDVAELEGKKLIIEADAGDIDVMNVKFDSTSISADAGDIDIIDSNTGRTTVGADMGDVTVDGRFEYLKASCDLGSINVDSEDANYDNMDLDVELGSIEVNGKNW